MIIKYDSIYMYTQEVISSTKYVPSTTHLVHVLYGQWRKFPFMNFNDFRLDCFAGSLTTLQKFQTQRGALNAVWGGTPTTGTAICVGPCPMALSSCSGTTPSTSLCFWRSVIKKYLTVLNDEQYKYCSTSFVNLTCTLYLFNYY